MKYVFILGHNPKLSVAEITAVLPQAGLVEETNSFLILESEGLDCRAILRRLGGTIKIGEIIGQRIRQEIIADYLKQLKLSGKLNFGLSYYDCKKNSLGMEVKKELKLAGINSRLVTGKDKALSSVIVTKNKCHDFLILNNKWLAITRAVQEFEEYSARDYGRPVRDMVSGSMPPKLAQIMINLARVPVGATILDPFCGSGTVLQEGLLLGYRMIGSDKSQKAVEDSRNNIQWLIQRLKIGNQNLDSKVKIFQSNAESLGNKAEQVDAIVTEPYLGPPLKGREGKQEIVKIINNLSELYIGAFGEFRKILKTGGRIVIIFPSFRVGKEILELPILEQIKKMGFTQSNRDKLIYSRPGQKVWRQIYIWQ